MLSLDRTEHRIFPEGLASRPWRTEAPRPKTPRNDDTGTLALAGVGSPGESRRTCSIGSRASTGDHPPIDSYPPYALASDPAPSRDVRASPVGWPHPSCLRLRPLTISPHSRARRSRSCAPLPTSCAGERPGWMAPASRSATARQRGGRGRSSSCCTRPALRPGAPDPCSPRASPHGSAVRRSI